MTLIESAKLSGLNPPDYLADVLARINEHKMNRLHELLPWNWKPGKRELIPTLACCMRIALVHAAAFLVFLTGAIGTWLVSSDFC
ncbi:transposase [Komagataeibacter xylinus NBRC 15237]|nr:transposase [Komagataeibacter xylinus NBRC 15237]